MTVPSTPRVQLFTGTGTTGPFSFNFPITLNNDGTPNIIVTLLSSTNAPTVLNTPADYSFAPTALGTGGGIITTTVAVANDGSRLSAEGNTPITQVVQYRNQGDFFGDTHEKSFDKATLILQELALKQLLSVRGPTSDATAMVGVLPAKSLRINKAIIFDANGDVAVSTDDYVNQAANAAASALLASQWASQTTGIVASTDYSAKAWSIGGTGVTSAAGKGAAKEWSITLGATVDGTGYSAREHAIGTTVSTGSSKSWASLTSSAVAGGVFSAAEYAQGTQAASGGSSKNWAQQTGADVTGAATNSRSAKSWSQDNLAGVTLGGSAKDWAQSGSLPDGTNKSAKSYASDASGSATTATTQAGISTAQAVIATTQATNSGNSATASAASASAATLTTTAGAFNFAYDSTITMASPGTGKFRLNNATIASVTAMAVMNTTNDSGNPDIGTFINAWDDSTHNPRGFITLRKVGAPATFAIFSVTGNLVDNTTWKQLALTYVTGNGTLTTADTFYVSFVMAGNDGTGTFSATGPTTDGEVVRSSGTTGNAGKYSGAATINNSLQVTGNIGIGTAPVSGAVIQNIQTLNVVGANFGVYNSTLVGSSVTALYNYYSLPRTAATAFTLGVLFHHYAEAPVIGAGSSITSMYGYGVENGFTTATNNYGFYGNIPAGATRWNLYMSGTAQNYLAGITGIGVAPNASYNLNVAGAANFGSIFLSGVQLQAAAQSDQETGTSTSTFVTPGRQQYHPSAAKYWGQFIGTTSTVMNQSYNHSSLTDNGTGDTTLNFTTAFSSAQYCAVTASKNVAGAGGLASLTTKAAGSYRYVTDNAAGSPTDFTDNNIVIYGDQ